MGASAGGVEALSTLVRALPASLPAVIFVVVHFPSHGTSVLPDILRRAGRLPAEHARDGETVQAGRIYVAPPGWHLLVTKDTIRLVGGPREHGFRPAIDTLFLSAAQAYGPRTAGVILSGTLSDGVAGLQAVKRAGGVTIVQDPEEAIYPGMPRSAIEQVNVDHILSLAQIAQTLEHLSQQPMIEERNGSLANENEVEAEWLENDIQTYIQDKNLGGRTVMTCPECGGLIWELQEGELTRCRCHAGHAYSTDSLLAEQAETLEGALWTAVRALEERASLLGRLSTQAAQRDSRLTASRFQKQAGEAERQADVIRQVLLQGKAIGLENSHDVKMMEETGEPASTGLSED